MGGSSSFNSSQVSSYYSRHSRSINSGNVEKIYRKDTVIDSMNPLKSKLPREACDSPACPDSRAVAIFYDTTASMNDFLFDLVSNQMKKIPVELPESVSFDPQILFGGVNDIRGYCGSDNPLQAGQFEAEFNRMIEQLTSIYIEGGGSGNGSESYILAYYFAARYTKLESLEKRGKKGFLLVIGDDGPTPDVTPDEIYRTFGKKDPEFFGKLSAEDVLQLAKEKFYVYQIIVHGDAYLHDSSIVPAWKNLLGGHAIDLEDYTAISSLICTILRMYDGMSKTDALNELSYTAEQEVIRRALDDHEEIVNTADAVIVPVEEEIEDF